MNRAPSPRDPWWPQHVQTCGGVYTKVKEPEGYGQKKSKKDSKKNDSDIATKSSVTSKLMSKCIYGHSFLLMTKVLFFALIEIFLEIVIISSVFH